MVHFVHFGMKEGQEEEGDDDERHCTQVQDGMVRAVFSPVERTKFQT